MIVGDSLAAGHGDPVPGLELVGWATRVAVALRTRYAGLRVANMARNGLTVDGIVRTQLAPAVAARPNLIVLIAGGNDVLARTWDPDAFRHDFRLLLEGLMAGGALVLTTTWHDVPRAVPMPAALGRRLSRRLAEAGAAVREVGGDLGAPCVDFWHMPALLDAGCYSADGIHPNARGYLRVAEVLADALGRHAGLPVPHGALRTPAEHRAARVESDHGCPPGHRRAWRRT